MLIVIKFLCLVGLFFAGLVIAGIYGALHDQISFTISSEYFTLFKYHQFGFAEWQAPDRFKASVIGFLATWWMGIPIGFFVGIAGLMHENRRLMLTITLKAFLLVSIVTLTIGLLGLAYGYFLASDNPSDYKGWYFPENLENPRTFIAVGFMHNFGYLGGIVGMFFGIAYQLMNKLKATKKGLP